MNTADYLTRCANLVRDRRLSLSVGSDLASAGNEGLLVALEAASDAEILELNRLHYLRRLSAEALAAAVDPDRPAWALLREFGEHEPLLWDGDQA